MMTYTQNCFYRECYSKPSRRHLCLYDRPKQGVDFNSVLGVCKVQTKYCKQIFCYCTCSKLLATDA